MLTLSRYGYFSASARNACAQAIPDGFHWLQAAYAPAHQRMAAPRGSSGGGASAAATELRGSTVGRGGSFAVPPVGGFSAVAVEAPLASRPRATAFTSGRPKARATAASS